MSHIKGSSLLWLPVGFLPWAAPVGSQRKGGRRGLSNELPQPAGPSTELLSTSPGNYWLSMPLAPRCHLPGTTPSLVALPLPDPHFPEDFTKTPVN